jgi:lysophospholipase L1-like esterase
MTTTRSETTRTRSGARQALFSIVLLALSLAVSLALVEIVLRVKNSSMNTYDIEMWRYAKELKAKSDDPHLDFDHVKSKSAVLQKVEVRLNEWGLRGGPVEPLPPGGRRILFLGGSIALGWGVAEGDTIEARLERSLRARGETVQVLNGGVGNYNADRYVSRFFKELAGLNPTDVVVHYFLRDAEDLPPGGGNIALRNSQTAVTLWIAYHRAFDRSGEASIVEHYRAAYRPDAPGFHIMQQKLAELADYAKAHGIGLYFAMTPDVHNLVDYKLAFIHDLMRDVATSRGYTFVDLLPALHGRPPEALFAMPGDPHPNALGHSLMAAALLPVIAQPDPRAETR